MIHGTGLPPERREAEPLVKAEAGRAPTPQISKQGRTGHRNRQNAVINRKEKDLTRDQSGRKGHEGALMFQQARLAVRGGRVGQAPPGPESDNTTMSADRASHLRLKRPRGTTGARVVRRTRSAAARSGRGYGNFWFANFNASTKSEGAQGNLAAPGGTDPASEDDLS